MRCLHCTRKPPRHAAWCREYVGEAPTTQTAIMPAIRPAEIPVVAQPARMGAPAWAVVCVALGLILAGLSVVTMGVIQGLATTGGVSRMTDEAKPSNGNERPPRPKPSGGNTRPTTGR